MVVDIPEELEPALMTEAEAHGVSAANYVVQLLKRSLITPTDSTGADQPLETGYGMWAKYGVSLSADEIDENRKDMFQKFGQDF